MLYNETKNNVVADNVEVADSFLKKFFGLMGRKGLKSSSCMLFVDCNSIHMCFMRFPIDVLFLDHDNQVVYMKKELQPWRVIMPVKNAYITIELEPGTIEKHSISKGDILVIK